MQIDLRELYVSYRDMILMTTPTATSKDALVTLIIRFIRNLPLSRQEEDWGWMTSAPSPSPRLAQMLGRPLCHTQGHRVVWRKDADLYRLKLLRSAIRHVKQKAAMQMGAKILAKPPLKLS